VAGAVVQVGREPAGHPPAADGQIARHDLEPIVLERHQEQRVAVVGQPLGGLLGDGRGGSEDQYLARHHGASSATGTVTRRQKPDEKTGSTKRANSRHSGKKVWKLRADMRASFAG